MKAFFGRWREDLPWARKYLVACRDYVMRNICPVSVRRSCAAFAWGMSTGSTVSGAPV